MRARADRRRLSGPALLVALPLLAALGAAGGCAAEESRPDVRIYYEAPADRRFETVEVIESVVDASLSPASPLERAAGLARAEAEHLGAEAVILRESHDEVELIRWRDSAHFHLRRHHFRWAVVRLAPEEPPPAP